MSWQDILKNKNNMNFITQQRKYLESTTALTQEQKTKLEDALDAMQPFVNRENFHDKYIKPYLEMQERLQ